jgi:hypothetical protein
VDVRPALPCLAALALTVIARVGGAAAQQVADPEADLTVARPAYRAPGPRVVIDAGHHNFHTADGRFAPFARLLANDGLTVAGDTTRLSDAALRDVAVLVIANALAAANAPDRWYLPTPSAFAPDEIAAIRRFVERGGGLLLLADHMPFAGAAHDLGAAFGVDFINGFAFSAPPDGPQRPDLFTRGNGGLADDPIVAGVGQVRTFTGSAFTARGPGVRPLLRLGRAWTILEPDTAWEFSARTRRVPGEGRLQGAAIEVGRGRVAVFGEAGMFTAQVTGADRVRSGLGAPGAEENKRFVLAVVRWLARGEGDR